MLSNSLARSVGVALRNRRPSSVFLKWTLLLAALSATGLPMARAQAPAPPLSQPTAISTGSLVETQPAPIKQPPEREIAIEGLDSFGHYYIFAGGGSSHLYTGGIEYDRHSWDYFLGAQMDYVAEILPLMLLNQPAKTDLWGDTLGPGRKTLYGVGISPVGLRMEWRSHKALKPFLLFKGGMLAFNQKALSPSSTYENFTLQSSLGILVKASPRYDLRLGLWGDFHFSNGFMTPSNPGLDVMNATVALSYHLGKPRSQ
ncbi:MAG: hypothetical protein WBX06_03515 [Acidobacteriaceae bacterium]